VAFNEIEIEGMNANDVYTNILEAGVTQAQANEFVGSWLLANAGKSRRTFDYRTAFPATEPDCTSNFHRSFVHRDWQDGEDLVQAQQSAGEDGFNLRFHKIENDLDALGADVAEAFLCLGEMRSSLRSLLDEIKAELNTIEGDLATLKQGVQTGPSVGFGTKFGGQYVGTTQFLGNYVDVFQDPTGQMILTPGIKVTGGTGGPVVDPEDRLGRATGFASFAATNEAFRGLFAGGKTVTKDQVLNAVGNVLVDGVAVSDLIDILPSTARFSSPESFASGLAEREGLALRTSGTGDAAVASALGFQGVTGAVGDASIHDFQIVPANARTALAAGGITSVGALSKMTPVAVATALREGGVTGVTAGDAAGWVAAAQTLGVIR
jgi:hypothetical protein